MLGVGGANEYKFVYKRPCIKKHLPLIEEKRKSNIKSKEKVTIAIFAEYNGNNVSAVCS